MHEQRHIFCFAMLCVDTSKCLVKILEFESRKFWTTYRSRQVRRSADEGSNNFGGVVFDDADLSCDGKLADGTELGWTEVDGVALGECETDGVLVTGAELGCAEGDEEGDDDGDVVIDGTKLGFDEGVEDVEGLGVALGCNDGALDGVVVEGAGLG